MSDFSGAKLFSVIVPLYNREQYIERTLNSVFAQSYRPIELIVVDDGSTDGSLARVQAWAQRKPGPGFSVVYQTRVNGGAASARNHGLSLANGQYLQFLDSDDSLHPQRLKLIAACMDEGADLVMTGFEGVDASSGRVLQTIYGRPGENLVDLAARGRLWANTLRSAITTRLARDLGPWNENMQCFEDREYFERAVLAARNPVALRDVLASARRGSGDNVSDLQRSYEGRRWRIHCEQNLADALAVHPRASTEAMAQFVSRLYGLATRSNAQGWADHGLRCMEIARRFEVPLNGKGRLRRIVAHTGPVGGRVYAVAGRCRQILSTWMKSGPRASLQAQNAQDAP